MTMKKLFNFAALALLASLGLSTVAQAEEIRVMTSGGFTAAYKILGPKFAAVHRQHAGHRPRPVDGQGAGSDPQSPGSR